MSISAILLQGFRLRDPEFSLEQLISQFQSVIRQILNNETLPDDLRQPLNQMGEVVAKLAPSKSDSNESLKYQICRLVHRLWHACEDAFTDPSLLVYSDELHNDILQFFSDLYFFAADVDPSMFKASYCAWFYHATGNAWHDLGKFDNAAICYEIATGLISKFDVSKNLESWESKLLLELNTARYDREVSDRNLRITLLNRLFSVESYYKDLANQHLAFVERLVSTSETNISIDASKFVNQALDLCEKGFALIRTPDDTAKLEELTWKVILYNIDVHMQKREYASVIECVSVLREVNGFNGDHSAEQQGSLPLLAMKAWLGLGNFKEAEKELTEMVIHKVIPEAVWVSAVEVYLQNAVAAGVETVNVVVSGLLELCNVSVMPVVLEVVFLRTLVTILYRENANEVEALKVLKHASARASELGTDCFYGEGEKGKIEQISFTNTSYDFATKCWQDTKYELCAEFSRLVSEVFGVSLSDKRDLVCKCLILRVASMIASEEQKKTTIAATEVKQAVKIIEKTAKILENDAANLVGPSFFFMYSFQAYNIYGRLNDSKSQQLAIVKNFASSNTCTTKYLLQFAIAASQGQPCNLEATDFAFNQCLSSLLSSPCPDYKDVALIFRKLITIKGDSDDDYVYGMCQQAHQVMVGLKTGEYPIDELKWLLWDVRRRAKGCGDMGQTDRLSRWMVIESDLTRLATRIQKKATKCEPNNPTNRVQLQRQKKKRKELY